ncbi:MAG: nitroreductase family protein [Thermoplasmatota archaeon]
MDVVRAIEERRAYRSLEPVDVTDDMVRELARCASLAASCFNNQPARFIFVRGREGLERMRPVFRRGNEWCASASMIVAVFTERGLDCVVQERDYYLFDTGMATASMILRATEMGLVAHPIAGFDEAAAKRALGIPDKMRLITLVLVGKRSTARGPALSDRQWEMEQRRPERLPFERFAWLESYPAGEARPAGPG